MGKWKGVTSPPPISLNKFETKKCREEGKEIFLENGSFSSIFHGMV